MPELLKPVLSLLASLVLAAGAWLFGEPEGRNVEGVAHVTDGDSLKVKGVEIRLKGVDAPELRQTCRKGERPYPCGEVSRTALIGFLDGRTVSCRITGRDRYRRSLAACAVGGVDLGGWLVERGLAVGYRDYEREEERARSRSTGVWAGEFQRPIDWRREHARRA